MAMVPDMPLRTLVESAAPVGDDPIRMSSSPAAPRMVRASPAASWRMVKLSLSAPPLRISCAALTLPVSFNTPPWPASAEPASTLIVTVPPAAMEAPATRSRLSPAESVTDPLAARTCVVALNLMSWSLLLSSSVVTWISPVSALTVPR